MKKPAVGKPGRPKSEEKRVAILFSAAELFLKRGFAHTSMEEVARRSGVSKQTVYSHFNNKDALFTAVIEAKCEQYKFFPEYDPQHQHNLKDVLIEMAQKCVALFHDEEVIAMYSTVIAEARNTPQIAKLFYQAGPQASIHSLGKLIYTMRGNKISQDKANELALDFYNMIKSEFHVRSLMGLPYSLDSERQNELVDAVVNKTLCLLQHYYQ
jgi:TetR/AcrR family transcriptional repressor of mexJK operon